VTEALLQKLRGGCDSLALELNPNQFALLCRYIIMLEKWNKAYNLTAVRDPLAMVVYHLLDSLSILPWVSGQRLLDVGTGAGLPGLPLAIACPQRQFALLDSNGKKTRFLQQVVADLGLNNVTVFQLRAQHLVDNTGFDMVLSRAFAGLEDMLEHTDHLLADKGRWLAMKGSYPVDELSNLPAGIELQAVEPVTVPELEAERHLVILRRQHRQEHRS
jgi:16S rRNA (guanine527-N7)-methyltransferase